MAVISSPSSDSKAAAASLSLHLLALRLVEKAPCPRSSWVFSSCGELGLLFISAFLVAEHGLQGAQASTAAVCRLSSCSSQA